MRMEERAGVAKAAHAGGQHARVSRASCSSRGSPTSEFAYTFSLLPSTVRETAVLTLPTLRGTNSHNTDFHVVTSKPSSRSFCAATQQHVRRHTTLRHARDSLQTCGFGQ